jgi:hypothetical protein
MPSDTKEISCLDDVPDVAVRLSRQQWIAGHYQVIALAPFAVVVFVTLKFFSQSTNRVWVWLTGLTLFWAIAVAGYAFYSLFWGVKCPACGSGFGSREECRSCGLPKHQGTALKVSKKLHFYD